MNQLRSIRAPIIGILIIETFALFVRSYLDLRLGEAGYPKLFAKDLSYLIVPPILAILLYPILRQHKDFLCSLLRRQDLTLRLVIAAIAVGFLMRVAWWCQVAFRGAMGIGANANPDPNAIVGPMFSFGCPPLHVILLGFFVMAFLIPIIEEVINRGLIQSSLNHRGRFQAILFSTILFTAWHTPGSYPTVFVAGLIMGMQFWNSRTLWFSIITHSTFNGLIQLDWRCVTGQWNPRPEEIPMTTTSIVSFCGFVISLVAIAYLIRSQRIGAR